MGMKEAFKTFATLPSKRVSGKTGLLPLLTLYQVRVSCIVFHISPENTISNVLSLQSLKSGKRFLKRSPLNQEEVHNFSIRKE